MALSLERSLLIHHPTGFGWKIELERVLLRTWNRTLSRPEVELRILNNTKRMPASRDVQSDLNLVLVDSLLGSIL